MCPALMAECIFALTDVLVRYQEKEQFQNPKRQLQLELGTDADEDKISAVSTDAESNQDCIME